MDGEFDTITIVNVVVGALVSVIGTLVLAKLKSIESKMDAVVEKVQENKTANAVHTEQITSLFKFKDRIQAKIWNGN